MKRLLPLGALLWLSACATNIDVDPEGYKCDVGDVCPAGYACVSGVCRADTNTGGCNASQCKTPPANTCKDASTLVAYGANGSCNTQGACSYASNEVACANGCADGKCVGDPCAGVTCDMSPATECTSTTAARVYTTPGSCDATSGLCQFAASEIPCPGGCANGLCNGQNLCGNVTCDMPPAPTCVGNAQKTYAATGTCEPSTGQCTYAETSTTCPGACVVGACVAATKSFTQIGPRVRSAVTALDLASATSSIVVGPKGYAAKWDGTAFTQLSTNTVQDLKSVWMRSASIAYLVGASGTALKVDGNTVTALTLPGVGTADLVSVHGKDATHILIAAANGTAWRSTDGTTFTKAPAPPTSYSYSMVQAYVGDDDTERIAGLCTTIAALNRPCLLYASSATSANWFADPNSTTTLLATGFGAVGPSLDSGYAFTGQGTTIYRHDKQSGNVDTINTPTGFTGTTVKGITRDSNNTNAAFFAVTGSVGRLYRWVKGSAPTELLTLYFATHSMSRNDSGGVLVGDSDSTAANIFRRGALTNEALDLAEDWVDVDATPAGRKVFINAFGDLASIDATKSVYDFARSPFTSPDYEGVVAATNYALLFGVSGKVVKYTPAGGFVTQAGGGTQNLHAGCRNSDAEVYLVGASGKILSYNGTALTAMSSGTTENLNAVSCTGMGEAFAVGANGTVLKLTTGTWAKVTPAIGTATALTSVFASPTELFVAGDNALYAYRQGAWKTLPGEPKLTQLVGFSASELYGATGADVVRFDGTGWTTAYPGSGADLVGSAVTGGKAIFVGAAGLIVEGK